MILILIYFAVNLSADHAAVFKAAIAAGKSLNQWAVEVLKQAAIQTLQ